MVQNERLPGVLLFSGQDHLGKRTIALEFIKILSCHDSDFSRRPCGACQSCQLIEQGRHSDVLEVGPLGKEIQIEQIRSLQKSLSLKPLFSNLKSFIINEAHCLNLIAQNCLLKTLEESQSKAIFILISSRPEILLTTIRSRCENVKFYPVPFHDMEEYFLESFSQNDLRKVLSIAEGRPGLVFNFLNDDREINALPASMKEASRVVNLKIGDRFLCIKNLIGSKESAQDVFPFLEGLTRYFRFCLWQGLGLEDNSWHDLNFILPKNYPMKRIKKCLELIEETKSLIRSTNVNPRLAIENLMLNV